MTADFRLLPCAADGFPAAPGLALPEFLRQACEQNARWYAQVGYRPPWIGYVAIARRADPMLAIAAQTLPEENASTAILRKLGFRLDGAIVHPEDGTIWEWRL